MAKKQLKVSQKQRRYRLGQKAAFGGEFVAMGTPYIVLGAINFDEWFRTTDGWKIGLGGSLAMALMCIAVLSITKKKEDKDSATGGYMTLMLVWLAVAFIFLLLANIMNDIATIMFFGAIGIAGAMGLDVTSKRLGERADMYQKAIKEIRGEIIKDEVAEEIRNEVQKEVDEEKVKVKIKVKDNE